MSEAKTHLLSSSLNSKLPERQPRQSLVLIFQFQVRRVLNRGIGVALLRVAIPNSNFVIAHCRLVPWPRQRRLTERVAWNHIKVRIVRIVVDTDLWRYAESIHAVVWRQLIRVYGDIVQANWRIGFFWFAFVVERR